MGFGGRTPKQRTQRGKVELYESETSLPFLWVEVNQVFSRGDIGYWNTRWVELEAQLRKCPYPLKKLGEFIPETVERDGTEVPGITYGQVGRREYPPAGTTIQQVNGSVRLLLPGTRRKEEREGVLYLQVQNVLRTGIDPYASPEPKRFVEKDSYNDPIRSRVHPGDLILVNSGIGSLGRCAVITAQYPYRLINISQHLTRVVLSGITPEWCCVYLQTKYGAYQVIRLASGVSGQIYIDFKEIGQILIPVPKKAIQQAFQEGYRNVVEYHLRALEAKSQGSQSRFERNLHIALGIQELLIWQAEQLIERQQDSVVEVILEYLPEALARLVEDEYAQVGAAIARQETRPELPSLQSRPLGIPLERDEEVIRHLAPQLRLLKGLKEFRDAATR